MDDQQMPMDSNVPEEHKDKHGFIFWAVLIFTTVMISFILFAGPIVEEIHFLDFRAENIEFNKNNPAEVETLEEMTPEEVMETLETSDEVADIEEDLATFEDELEDLNLDDLEL